MNNWLYIAIFLFVSIVMPTSLVVIGLLLGPKRPNPIKTDTYECGVQTWGETWVQFKIQYYLFALVFLVFDIEVAFLYPWAVAYKALPLFAVLEGVLFIVLLTAALVYAWRKGALEWS